MKTLMVKTGIKAGQSATQGPWVGVPTPANAEFQAENPIHEGGMHAHFTSSQSPGDIVNSYSAAVKKAGWTVVNQGGDPWGIFGGGLTARQGARFLKLNTGAGHINVCSWPSQPNNNNCGQNQNN
jgi:hypothetical protein